jgi:uncharacterized membrane protein
MATNPYAAPQARVHDAGLALAVDGNFIAEGQSLPAGRGWQWLQDGWTLFRAQPGTWIGVTIGVMLFYVVLGLIPWIGQLAVSLLTPVIGGGLLLGLKALDEGGELRFGHLFEGFRIPQTGRLVMVGAASLVATIAIVLVILVIAGAAGGLALLGSGGAGMSATSMLMALLAVLVVAAISIPLYMALWFAPALVVFHDQPPVAAMKASFFACLKNMVPFLVYGIAAMLLVFAALIPFGLGLLVAMPMIIASVYTGYRDIFFAR